MSQSCILLIFNFTWSRFCVSTIVTHRLNMCFQFSLVYFKFSLTFLFQFLFSCKFIVFGFFYFTDYKYWAIGSVIYKLFYCFHFISCCWKKTNLLSRKLIQVIYTLCDCLWCAEFRTENPARFACQPWVGL